MGELKNFPPEARQKIEAAGGLKHFLLESLRFVMHDSVIGLMTHAVYFQHALDNSPSHIWSTDDSEPTGSCPLNPTAKEFLPQFKHLSVNDTSEPYDQCSSAVLPSPYVLMPHNVNCAVGMQDTSRTINALSTEAFSSDNNYINFKDDICKTISVQVRSLNYSIIVVFCTFRIK